MSATYNVVARYEEHLFNQSPFDLDMQIHHACQYMHIAIDPDGLSCKNWLDIKSTMQKAVGVFLSNKSLTIQWL